MAAPAADGSQQDAMRLKHGFNVVLVGVAAIFAVFVVAVIAIAQTNYDAQIVTLAEAIAGIIGTMVGAFFGLQLGAQGKEKSDEERRQAQEQLTRLAAAVEPSVARSALNLS